MRFSTAVPILIGLRLERRHGGSLGHGAGHGEYGPNRFRPGLISPYADTPQPPQPCVSAPVLECLHFKEKIIPTSSAPKDLANTVETILASLHADNAQDIRTIDLVGKTTVADQMIVASGTSGRMVSALAQHIVTKLKAMGLAPRSEGEQYGDWVLVDAGDVVVHLFRPEVRAFYDIERLWASPVPVPVKAAAKAASKPPGKQRAKTAAKSGKTGKAAGKPARKNAKPRAKAPRGKRPSGKTTPAKTGRRKVPAKKPRA